MIDQELAAISNNRGGSVSPEIAGVWSDEMIDFISMQKRMEHNSLEILRQPQLLDVWQVIITIDGTCGAKGIFVLRSGDSGARSAR